VPPGPVNEPLPIDSNRKQKGHGIAAPFIASP
jgi:hypothetical protein